MLLSKSPARIIGVALGEVHINLIKSGIPPITANFALVRDDEEYAGLVERRMGWTEEVMKALAALQDAMERDMLDHLFTEQPAGAAGTEPQQV